LSLVRKQRQKEDTKRKKGPKKCVHITKIAEKRSGGGSKAEKGEAMKPGGGELTPNLVRGAVSGSGFRPTEKEKTHTKGQTGKPKGEKSRQLRIGLGRRGP